MCYANVEIKNELTTNKVKKIPPKFERSLSKKIISKKY
jgi:hypothetical protein